MNKLLDFQETIQAGWFKDAPDDRDWKYEDAFSSVDLPVSVDFTKHLTWKYQGNAPACVGFAIAHQIQIEESIRGLRSTLPSPAYIWIMSRIQHQRTIDKKGTFPRLAYNGIKHMGCPPEAFWPYRTNEPACNEIPNYKAKSWASGRMGLKYYRISHNRCDTIRQALANGHPVTIGTKVLHQMRRYIAGDVVSVAKNHDELGGGHYMVIIGYHGTRFIVANSWRSSPRMLFHEDVIEWEKSNDFYVITEWEDLKG